MLKKPKPPQADTYDYYWDEAAIKDINVYEDTKLKSRQIGFIWDNPKIVVEK